MSFKITAALREYFRYVGASADAQRQGLGPSRPELAWAKRQKQQASTNSAMAEPAEIEVAGSDPLHKD